MVPISEASLGYAQDVRRRLRAAHLQADVDASDRKMQKKVREAQLEQYNYILVRSRGSTDAQHASVLLRAQHACVLGYFECGFHALFMGWGTSPSPPKALEPGNQVTPWAACCNCLWGPQHLMGAARYHRNKG